MYCLRHACCPIINMETRASYYVSAWLFDGMVKYVCLYLNQSQRGYEVQSEGIEFKAQILRGFDAYHQKVMP